MLNILHNQSNNLQWTVFQPRSAERISSSMYATRKILKRKIWQKISPKGKKLSNKKMLTFLTIFTNHFLHYFARINDALRLPTLNHSHKKQAQVVATLDPENRPRPPRPGYAGSFSFPPCKSLSQVAYHVPRPRSSTLTIRELCDYALNYHRHWNKVTIQNLCNSITQCLVHS